MEDDRIIELYFDRDEQAIRHTADKYGAYCTAVSMNILRSEPDAEECVNDTYLKTWNSIPPTRPHSLKLFLARIVRNLSLNRHRDLHSDKRNRDLEVSLSELEPCFPVLDSGDDGGVLGDLLNEFLDQQSKEDRIVFVQRYWYSLSAADIAEEQGLSENTVWVKLHRTRERLRIFLNERGFKL